MPRFALTLEFDGGPFFGFQRQKDGPSIQRSVEAAIHGVTGQQVALHSAGRTDAGVHAVAMRCHCDIDTALTPFRLTGAINAHLRPDPIAVTQCEVVPDDWHARFACVERRYLYRIVNRRAPLTLDRERAWQIVPAVDARAMHRAAQLLVGQHDFTTFRSAHCQSRSPVKTLDRLDVERKGEEIRVHAAARSFLHHQVRSMVGCLALVGMGRWSEEKLVSALEARDRQRLGLNAPPHGLYFMEAIYPDQAAEHTNDTPQERDR